MSNDYLISVDIFKDELKRLEHHNFRVYKCTLAVFELAKVDDNYLDIRITKYLDAIAKWFTLQDIDDCIKLFNFLFKYGVKGELLLDLIESKYQKDISRFRDAAWSCYSSYSISEFYDNRLIDKLIAMAPQKKTPEEVIKELQEII